MNLLRARPRLRTALAAALGAALGLLFYRLVGCRSGNCLIASSPYLSTLYGAGVGLLLGRPARPSTARAGGASGEQGAP